MSYSINQLQLEVLEHLKCDFLKVESTPEALYASFIQHLVDKVKREIEGLEVVLDDHDCKMQLKGFCECSAIRIQIKELYRTLR